MALTSNKNFAQHLPEIPVDRIFMAPQPVDPGEVFVKSLSLNGAEATADMNIDGTTPKQFFYTVPSGKRLIISRFLIECQDASIDFRYWFGFGAVLTNGCSIYLRDTDGSTILQSFGTDTDEFGLLKRTIDFAHLAAQDLAILQVPSAPTSPEVMVIRWSVFKTGYVPVLSAGQRVEFMIRDNLSAMDAFQVTVQGRLFDE